MFEYIQNVETSMDDIVILGSDTKSHLLTVKKVLDICKSYNANLNWEKCLIAVEELIFLRDRLIANRLKPNLAQVKHQRYHITMES